MSQHQPPEEKPKGFKFDPTINLGHVLTMALMLMAGSGAWMAMDTRVVRLEESRATQVLLSAAQAVTLNEKFADLKEAIRDVKRIVEDPRDRSDRTAR